MPTDLVTVAFGTQSMSVPLPQFITILEASEPGDCITRYRKERLRRRAVMAIRHAHPDKRQEFQLQASHYWLGICERTYRCYSLSSAILTSTRWLHDNHPDALDALARKRKHSRAFIGREPSAIYPNRPHLEAHARSFAPGWFADTNLSCNNTRRFLEVIFASAGLEPHRQWYFNYLG